MIDRSLENFLVQENIRKYAFSLLTEIDQAKRNQLRRLIKEEALQPSQTEKLKTCLADIAPEIAAKIYHQERLVQQIEAHSSDVTGAALLLENMRDALRFLDEVRNGSWSLDANPNLSSRSTS